MSICKIEKTYNVFESDSARFQFISIIKKLANAGFEPDALFLGRQSPLPARTNGGGSLVMRGEDVGKGARV